MGKQTFPMAPNSNFPKKRSYKLGSHVTPPLLAALLSQCLSSGLPMQNLQPYYILHLCFLRSVPISGIVYVWIGSKSDPEDVKVAEEIVQQGILYDKERFSMQVSRLDTVRVLR